MWRLLLHLLLVAGMLCGLVWSAHHADQAKPKEALQEYLYISKHPELRKFAFGFESEMADFLWINSLQGFAKHCLDKVPFKNIDQVYDAITDMDPHFIEAYRTGSLYVAIAYKSSLRGIQILEKGSRKVADKPWIWELLGRMYWLERFLLEKRQEMSKEESTRRAIDAIAKAVSLGGGESPQLLLDFLMLRDKGTNFDELIWLDFYARAGKNSLIKTLALLRLQRQLVKRHLDFLHNKIQQYREAHQAWPAGLDVLPKPLPYEPSFKDMEQLASELLAMVQNNQSQEALIHHLMTQTQHLASATPYKYNPATGEVTAQILEEQRLTDILSFVQMKIDRFFIMYQRYPADLEELRLSPAIAEKKLPELPFGKNYGYRPADGAVWAQD